MYEGEWVDKDYAVAGDILDGVSIDPFLYALLKFNVTRTKIKSFIYTVPL